MLRKLSRLRKEQLQDRNPIKEDINYEKNLPVEEIVKLLIPNKDKEKEDEYIIDKFSIFMSAEENADYIIDMICKISELKDYKTYDFTEYFEKIKSVDLSSSNE